MGRKLGRVLLALVVLLASLTLIGFVLVGFYAGYQNAFSSSEKFSEVGKVVVTVWIIGLLIEIRSKLHNIEERLKNR